MPAKKNLRVAMIAPPWLTVPPKGYGGTENVIDGLVRGLMRLGVEVELFSTGRSGIRGPKHHMTYKHEMYEEIYRPYYETLSIAAGQVMMALNTIADDGTFDIIHDHNQYVGPAILSWAVGAPNVPPALHTHHGPPFTTKEMVEGGDLDNTPLWREIPPHLPFYMVGISETLMKTAPRKLKPSILDPVYNGIEPKQFPFHAKKQDYFITLSRFSQRKGQHLAVKICNEEGYKLRMAGSVAGIASPQKLLMELANPTSPYRQYPNFRYYSDKIFPIVAGNPRITYSGDLSGKRKLNFLANAKALLFPIEWVEPFGMVVIEAMACGTPVVAMNRGAMSEIIDHGVNGFLAENEKEFREYIKRVDEIDPAACRRTVEECFSADVMAKNYLDRYREILKLK